MVTFLLNNDKYTEDIALAWEKEVFMKVIDSYNAGNLTSPDQPDATIFNNITVTYMAQRSIPDELVDQTKYHSNFNSQNTDLFPLDPMPLSLSSVIPLCSYTLLWLWEASLIKFTQGIFPISHYPMFNDL